MENQLGVLRSFSRPRVSNDNPYSESLFRTVKYRPDYPRRPFGSKDEACQWVAGFVDWYNHQHRHSAIRFVTGPPPVYRTVRQRSPLTRQTGHHERTHHQTQTTVHTRAEG